jgi:hypothetical protein
MGQTKTENIVGQPQKSCEIGVQPRFSNLTFLIMDSMAVYGQNYLIRMAVFVRLMLDRTSVLS